MSETSLKKTKRLFISVMITIVMYEILKSIPLGLTSSEFVVYKKTLKLLAGLSIVSSTLYIYIFSKSE